MTTKDLFCLFITFNNHLWREQSDAEHHSFTHGENESAEQTTEINDAIRWALNEPFAVVCVVEHVK
jgi:hypothetical protein